MLAAVDAPTRTTRTSGGDLRTGSQRAGDGVLTEVPAPVLYPLLRQDADVLRGCIQREQHAHLSVPFFPKEAPTVAKTLNMVGSYHVVGLLATF